MSTVNKAAMNEETSPRRMPVLKAASKLKISQMPSITAQQVGMLWHGLSLWPQPDPATWDVPVGTSACDIHGVLVWGWQ